MKVSCISCLIVGSLFMVMAPQGALLFSDGSGENLTHQPAISSEAFQAGKSLNDGSYIEYLKDLLQKVPDDTYDDSYYSAKLELSITYLKLGNRVWAVKTLKQIPKDASSFLQAQSLLTWIAIQNGNFNEARFLLRDPIFTATQPMKHRALFFETYMKGLDSTKNANPIQPYRFSTTRVEIFEEDQSLYQHLVARNLLAERPLFKGKINLGIGTSDNPYLTADILDSKSLKTKWEWFWQTAADFEWIPWYTTHWNPILGFNISDSRYYLQFLENAFTLVDQPISQHQFHGTVGITFHQKIPWEIMYLPSLVMLEGGDQAQTDQKKPFWFRESHLFRIKLTASKSLQLFIKSGYSEFRRFIRSRFQIATGAYWYLPLIKPLQFYLLGEVDWHQAKHEAYHLFGVRIAPIIVLSAKSFRITFKSMLNFSNYYASHEYYRFNFPNLEKPRQDYEWGNSLQLTYSTANAVDLNAQMEYTKVFSNISWYDSHEWRFQIQGTYRMNLALPILKKQSSLLTGRFTFIDPKKDTETDSASTLSVEEILQKEELNRRGSSCIDR